MRVYKGLIMVVEDRPGQVGVIGSILGNMGVLIKNIQLTRLEDEDLEVELLLHLPAHISITEIIEELSDVEGLKNIQRLN